MRASTSTTASALRASYLEANRIAKLKRPFTIGEELTLPANKDICSEVFLYITGTSVDYCRHSVQRGNRRGHWDTVVAISAIASVWSHIFCTATKPEIRSRLDIKNPLWVSLAQIIPRWDRIRDQGNKCRTLIDLCYELHFSFIYICFEVALILKSMFKC